MIQQTTHDAYQTIKPRASTLRGLVLAYISECGNNGSTDEETQRALGMNPSTQRPRRLELEELGYVFASGFKRQTTSGRNAIVWVAKPRQFIR